MIVKLKKQLGSWQIGYTTDLNEDFAKNLIAKGLAERTDNKAIKSLSQIVIEAGEAADAAAAERAELEAAREAAIEEARAEAKRKAKK